MTKYRGYWINLDVLGGDLFNVFIDNSNWYGTVKGEENAIARGQEYIDEIIDVKEAENAPDEPERDDWREK
jgi:hypothetical protein